MRERHVKTGTDVQITLDATQANALKHCLREQLQAALYQHWYADAFEHVPARVRAREIFAQSPALAAQKAALIALVAAQREPRR
jgi:hypothetical protein